MIRVNATGALNLAYAALPLLKNTANSLLFSTASSAAIRGLSYSIIVSWSPRSSLQVSEFYLAGLLVLA